MKKKVVILGSTGSIGTQTLDVVDATGKFEVVGLSANSNIDLLTQQVKKYNVKNVSLSDPSAYKEFKRLNIAGNVLYGLSGLLELASMPGCDIVVNALVGSIGLKPTLLALENKKTVALANKETLVTAGGLVMEAAKENNANIYPVDSEHSAIFQCLQGQPPGSLSRVHLTASGGAFRGYTKEMLGHVTLGEALKHPNWSMGPKITIDSSTMMNKGLEVIEAKFLFDLEPEGVNVLIHPQSIIHSMVEFKDGAVLAQLGCPDMRVPIAYALNYPERQPLPFEKINFLGCPSLTFEKPDFDTFPCLGFAYSALEAGGGAPCVLNMANETAVSLFMGQKIKFTDIPLLIEKAMGAYNVKNIGSLDDVLDTELWAREYVLSKAR
ncbi:MAG: 1-deoxy-D-xylulose-5-phosphate reductoisomerase [Clostridiales bacterium]|nr:1-deoxy-D-xylulose-5-phosphate reductoisomerase [Clostridiales bacterium]